MTKEDLDKFDAQSAIARERYEQLSDAEAINYLFWLQEQVDADDTL